MSADDALAHVMNARLVYHLPNEEQVSVTKNIPFKRIGDLDLHMDIYTPSILTPMERRPVVFFISGDTPREYMLGMKDWGVYVGWGRLVAAAGLIGISFQHRVMDELQPAAIDAVLHDITDAIAYGRTHADAFHIDPERIGLWCASAGAIAGLYVGLAHPQPWIRCLISYYGLFDLALYAESRNLSALPTELRQRLLPITYLYQYRDHIPPLLIARMEHDIPGFNGAIDTFVTAAQAMHAPVTVLNHSEGHHGFDTEDDNDQSRTIIQRTLSFMQQHLQSLP